MPNERGAVGLGFDAQTSERFKDLRVSGFKIAQGLPRPSSVAP